MATSTGEARRARPGPAFLVLCLCIAVAFGQAAFRNNDDPWTTTAAYTDTGTILSAQLRMIEPEHLFNQHASFHSRLYGWTPNTIVFVQFLALRHVLGLEPQEHHSTYALVSRLNNLLFSLGVLAALYFLAQRLLGAPIVALVVTALSGCFFPFLTYSYQLHPEPAGTFFALLALHGLVSFLEDRTRSRSFLLAVLCAALSALSKQAFSLVFIAVATAWVVARLEDRRAGVAFRAAPQVGLLLGSVLIVAVTAFVIHPRLFLEFGTFRRSMEYLSAHHGGTHTLLDNWRLWWGDLLSRDWSTLAGLTLSVICLATGFRASVSPRATALTVLASYNVAYALVVCSVVRPASINYVYPIHASLLLVSAGFVLRHRDGLPIPGLRRPLAGRMLGVGLLLLLSVNAVRHLLGAVAELTGQMSFGCTAQYEAAARLPARPWRVIAFPTVPVPVATYQQVLTSDAFPQSGASLVEVLRRVQPDAIVVDRSFHAPARVREFIDAARQLGLNQETSLPTVHPPHSIVTYTPPINMRRSLRIIEANLTRCERRVENGETQAIISVFSRGGR